MMASFNACIKKQLFCPFTWKQENYVKITKLKLLRSDGYLTITGVYQN